MISILGTLFSYYCWTCSHCIFFARKNICVVFFRLIEICLQLSRTTAYLYACTLLDVEPGRPRPLDQTSLENEIIALVLYGNQRLYSTALASSVMLQISTLGSGSEREASYSLSN